MRFLPVPGLFTAWTIATFERGVAKRVARPVGSVGGARNASVLQMRTCGAGSECLRVRGRSMPKAQVPKAANAARRKGTPASLSHLPSIAMVAAAIAAFLAVVVGAMRARDHSL